MIKFNKWFKKFLEEKDLDMSELLFKNVQIGDICKNVIIGDICKNIMSTRTVEKNIIKNTIMKIDFKKADIKRYFRFLARKRFRSILESEF